MPIRKTKQKAYSTFPERIIGKGLVDNPITTRVTGRPTALDSSAEEANKAVVGGFVSMGTITESEEGAIQDRSFLVRDVDGTIIAKFGNLEDLSWGGSSFTLPKGTFGIWGIREGTWLKSYVVSSYANYSTQSVQFTMPAVANTDTYEYVIDEEMPFDTLVVAQGRVVFLEFDYMFGEFTSPDPFTVTPRLVKKQYFASKDGAPTAITNFLAGPSTVGTAKYTDISIQLTFQVHHASGFASGTATHERIAGIRLQGQEVNQDPIVRFSSDTTLVGQAAAEGSLPEGPNADPGGGTGESEGGVEGGTGGGNLS